MHITVFCTFMPFCNTYNLNLWDEPEDNRFQLFMDIIITIIKETILLNANFINSSYNDITLCISLCVTRKQHTLLWETEEGNFLPFIQTSKLHIYQMPKFNYWFPSRGIFYTIKC